MRTLIIFCISLLLFSASIIVGLSVTDLRAYELRGYADPAGDQSLPFRTPRIGVNAELLQYQDPAELRQHLDWMQAAHIYWVRQFVYWDTIEQIEGSPDWSQWDQITSVLRDYSDLQLVVVFMNSPEWSRSATGTTGTPPDDYQDFTQFVATFARRYGEQIDYYQVWDEPNLYESWGLTNPNPVEYAAMLAATYPAIHHNDLEATVIAAALAPTTERGGQNIADLIFLEQLYRLGAQQYFDAVGAKPYGFDSSPLDRTINLETLNFSRIIRFREIMVQYNDGAKPVWASAWGWNALPADWGGNPSIWGQVDAATQVQNTLNAFARAEREWPWLAGMALYHWQPFVPHDDPRWGFAIIGPDNSPGRLWTALSELPEITHASNGRYPAASQFARFSGLWTFGELGADIGWLETSDSVAEFDFAGTDISLLLREGNYFGFLYPLIDNAKANAVPRDSQGNAYILLRSPSLEIELNQIPVGRNLQQDNHTLRLIADRGWDQWALVGFAVSDGDLAAPYNHLILLAWGTSFFALAAVFTTAGSLIKTGFFRRILTLYIYPPLEITFTALASVGLLLSALLTWNQADAAIFRRESVDASLLLLVTGGLMLFELPFVLFLIFNLMLFILIYRHLTWGLVLISFYAPFFLFPVELYRFAFPLSEIILFLTTGAWAVRELAQIADAGTSLREYAQRMINAMTALDWSVGIYVGIGLAALALSQLQDPARTEFRTLFFEPALFYMLIRVTGVNISWLVKTLIFSGVCVSAIGIFLYWRGEAVITTQEGARRLASVYGSPNNVSLLLSRVLPFALAYFLSTRTKQKYLWLIILSVFGITLALTQSVGGLFIGAPVGILTVILLSLKRKRFGLLVLFLILLSSVLLAVFLLGPRLEQLLDLTSGTAFMRLRVWESSIDILREHPLTGIGLDQFLYQFRSHYIRPDAIADPNLSHPHNILLDFWIRLGLPGVGWLVAVMILFWRKSWLLLVANPAPVVIAAMGSMASLLVYGMIDNSVFVPDMAFIFFLLLLIPYDKEVSAKA